MLLVASAGTRDRGGVTPAGEGAAQRLEMLDPLGASDQTRVGDRVGGASQQVRQPQRLAQRTRQDRQREIETATDPTEQTAEQLVLRLAQRDPAMATQL